VPGTIASGLARKRSSVCAFHTMRAFFIAGE